MKKVIFLFAFLMMNALVFGQMTKNVGSHKFENGTEIKEGSIVKFLTGKNPQTPGVYLWVFEGGSMPIPKMQCDESFDGKEFTVTKVLSLKGIANKDESIIAVFEVGKKKFYCFITQGLKAGELSL